MDFAILAAGEGSRLKTGGIAQSKPMVLLHGIPLIQRLLTIFLKNGAERIFVVINKHSPDVDAYLAGLQLPIPIKIIRADTPSSLHSFYELLPYLDGEQFCLTTVDTVFEEAEFSRYVRAFSEEESLDGLMAVTSFVDDESPLYVKTGAAHAISAFLDGPAADVNYVSGGVYCLRRPVVPVVQKAVRNGVQRMRNLQRMLIDEGMRLQAFPFSKIIDIDHVHDLSVAEGWLQAGD